MSDRNQDNESANSEQRGYSPPPLPSVRDTTPNLVRTIEDSSRSMPPPSYYPQSNFSALQQGFAQGLGLNIEDVQLNRSHHSPRSYGVASFDLSPSDKQSDRPWSHLQNKHSSRTFRLRSEPVQYFAGLGTPFVYPAWFNTGEVFGPTSAQDGFNSLGALNTAVLQLSPSTSGSFGFAAPSSPFLLPEAVGPAPLQPFPDRNSSFTISNPFLGFQDNVGTQSLGSAAAVSSENLVQRRTQPPSTRARGARGEARRGQPRPRGWTTDEERTLLRIYTEEKEKCGKSQLPTDVIKQIAEAMGKSYSAVVAKYWRLQGGDPKAYKKNKNHRGGTRG